MNNDESVPDRRAAIVYNPVKDGLDELRNTVEEAEGRYGFAPSLWLETSEEDPGVSMAKDAIAQGVTVVLAVGGDGTVRAVAEGLRGSDTPLAVIPKGTGNLLARNLGIPIDDLPASVAAALDGDDRAIDLGVIELVRTGGEREEHSFAVMTGVGLDAQLIVNQDEDLKKKAGWLAYVKSLGASLKGGRRIKVRYVLGGGEPRVAHVHTLLVGNCGTLPANIVLLPEAEIDDGILDIALLRPDGALGWASIVMKVFVEHAIMRRSEVGRRLTTDRDGKVKHIRALRYLRGDRLRVQLRDPEDIELDGDHFGEVREFTTRVEPGALTVRVPAAA